MNVMAAGGPSSEVAESRQIIAEALPQLASMRLGPVNRTRPPLGASAAFVEAFVKPDSGCKKMPPMSFKKPAGPKPAVLKRPSSGGSVARACKGHRKSSTKWVEAVENEWCSLQPSVAALHIET